jgi:hypothetical protein
VSANNAGEKLPSADRNVLSPAKPRYSNGRFYFAFWGAGVVVKGLRLVYGKTRIRAGNTAVFPDGAIQ